MKIDLINRLLEHYSDPALQVPMWTSSHCVGGVLAKWNGEDPLEKANTKYIMEQLDISQGEARLLFWIEHDNTSAGRKFSAVRALKKIRDGNSVSN